MNAGMHLKYVMLIFLSFLIATLFMYFSKQIFLYSFLFVVPVIISALAYRFKGLSIIFSASALTYLFLIYVLSVTLTSFQISKLLLDIFLFLGVGLVIAEMSEIQRRQRKTISELAFRDKVTGVYTRNYFVTLLDNYVNKATRCDIPFSIAIVDIDDLGEFNYTFGYEKGNFLLNKVARILEQNLRYVDAIARFGAGEFAVLLACAEGDPKIAGERVRKAIEKEEFEGDAEQPIVKKTVSIGVASFPKDAYSADDLIARAIKAKNYAKKLGKNRVCESSSLLASDVKVLSKD